MEQFGQKRREMCCCLQKINVPPINLYWFSRKDKEMQAFLFWKTVGNSVQTILTNSLFADFDIFIDKIIQYLASNNSKIVDLSITNGRFNSGDDRNYGRIFQ
jgi:hypothetical protein